jgi:hypothetical protein
MADESEGNSTPCSFLVDGEVESVESQPDGFDIFVSYRVRPDEELAGELRTLLEATIDPKPRVFVSGLGGLRASADGYRDQLRKAARNARVYVGLITKASIDREWIFFEAGAAFGRSVLYAPVLVDVSASELPESIGGYQGITARDQARMRELTEDLAKELGAQAKGHFAQRFARFAKAVEDYGKEGPDEELSGVPLAIRLMQNGRRDESEKLFDELIEAADSPEEKANIGITKLVFSRKEGTDLLELLEAQPIGVKTTAVCKLWTGDFETNPLKAVKLLREAYEGSLEGFHKRLALTALARKEFELGHTPSATARLLDALSSEDRHLRGDAAQCLAAQLENDNSIGKLLLLVEGILDPSLEHLVEAARYCRQKEYTALALHISNVCVAQKDSGESHLWRGLARHQAMLRSLAFEDYRASSKHGVPVAKSNMASLLNSGAVAEAGLEILRDHAGEFSCDDPGLSYQVRSELERSIELERKTERDLCAYGDRAVKAMHRLVEGWLRRDSEQVLVQGSWKAAGSSDKWTAAISGTVVSVNLNGKALTVQCVPPFEGFHVALEGTTLRLLFVIGAEFEAVAVDGFATVGKLEWLQFRPASEEVLSS